MHNVVAASAVVGLVGREGEVIRKTLLVFIYYALFTGSIGYGIISFGTAGLLNTGFIIAATIVLAACAIIIKYGSAKNV